MFYSRPRWGMLALRLGMVALFLLPLFWLLSASLMPPGRPLPMTFQLLPNDATFANYRRVWELLPFGRYLLNSLLVVATAVPITLLTSSWAGLAMALLPDKRQRQLILLSLIMLMVPGIALWTTRFMLYKWLGLLDTRWALILPAFMGSSPFFVLMFYRAFRRIPRPMFEVAIVDGATVYELWRRIGMPQILPTSMGVALLTFILYWGDFSSPLLYLSSESRYTVPIALQLLQQMSRSDWPLLMAGAVWVTAVPVLLLFLMYPFFKNRG